MTKKADMDPYALDAYLTRRSMERREGRSTGKCRRIELFGCTWPTVKAFCQAMGVNDSWYNSLCTAAGRTPEECALAVFAARMWHGADAERRVVQKAALKLVKEDEGARIPAAAEPAGNPCGEEVPACDPEAAPAVKLFQKALGLTSAKPGQVERDWKVVNAGEGRWKFLGEEIVWIVEPERQRLECWLKGRLVREWEKGVLCG